jgi:hypothetical protein
MQSLKRDITTGLAMSALALAIALAWGNPFVGPRAAHAQSDQPEVQRQIPQIQPPQTAKSKPHPGTVSHDDQQ